MGEYGVKPNVQTFNSVLGYIERNPIGFDRPVEGWIQLMAKEGVEPNLQTFDRLIRICGGRGDVHQAWETWMLLNRVKVMTDE